MNLPAKYQWLQNIIPLPKILEEGLKYLGLKEIPGQASNPAILQMAKTLGVADIYKNDDISWCALFISFLCKTVGKPLPDNHGDRYNIIRAAWFQYYGEKSPVPQLGDVLVFKRPGGHHVGIYVAESKDTYHVLGGNQSNAVTITEISKIRMAYARRFYHTAPPATVKAYLIDSSGHLSTNES